MVGLPAIQPRQGHLGAWKIVALGVVYGDIGTSPFVHRADLPLPVREGLAA